MKRKKIRMTYLVDKSNYVCAHLGEHKQIENIHKNNKFCTTNYEWAQHAIKNIQISIGLYLFKEHLFTNLNFIHIIPLKR